MRPATYLKQSVRELLVPPRSQLPTLDMLRTIAVSLVIFEHGWETVASLGVAYAPLVLPIYRFAWTGVDLFFILSGLLIGKQLWSELLRTGSIKVGRFLLRRGLRIWPLYFLFALLSPLLWQLPGYRWPDWVFLSNYALGGVSGGWSLSTEEHFYIVAPLALLLVPLRGKRTMWWFAAIPIVLVAVQVVRLFAGRALLATGMNMHDTKAAIHMPFHLHNEGLLIGMLLALLWVTRPDWVLGRAGAPLTRLRAAAIGLAVLGLVLRALNPMVFAFLSLGLVYGAITFLLLDERAQRWGFVRLRGFYTLSRLSYGMYLNHFVLVHWVEKPMAAWLPTLVPPTLASILGLGIFFASSIAVAAVTFVLVERPFLLVRERWLHAHAREHGQQWTGGAAAETTAA
ncbi:MAG: acyltransferase [Gemmatimonadota bacterium]